MALFGLLRHSQVENSNVCPVSCYWGQTSYNQYAKAGLEMEMEIGNTFDPQIEDYHPRMNQPYHCSTL